MGEMSSNAGSVPCEGYSGFLPYADINGDGCIGLADQAELLGVYGSAVGDGIWAAYVWDAENRLILVEPPAAKTLAAGDVKVEFKYDYMGRRVEKRVYTYDGTAWVDSDCRRFVYYNWLPLLEIQVTNPYSPGVAGGPPAESAAILRKYTWGLDLAGQNGSVNSIDAAGGIGGLLACYDTNYATDGEDPTANDKKYIYFYDANGNVGQVIDWTNAAVTPPSTAWSASRMVATYEYDPYGNVTASAGAYADDNPFRFSTKYWDDETGLGNWGYRYYSARLGRWVSRDPIAEYGAMLIWQVVGVRAGTTFIQRDGSEPGGSNRYAYVFNAPQDRIDPIGLMGCTRTPQLPPAPSPGQICGCIPNQNPTDADCCNAARPKCAKGDGGGVICCNGRKVSCSFWQPNPAMPGDPILEACIIVHEDDHHDDVSCAGCPTGLICRPNWDPGKKPNNEECSAYWKETDCLLRQGQTTCHSRGTVASQIACVQRVEQRIKQLCNTMKNNLNCKTLPGICSAYGIKK